MKYVLAIIAAASICAAMPASAEEVGVGVGVGPVGAGVTVGSDHRDRERERTTVIKEREREPRETTVIRERDREPDRKGSSSATATKNGITWLCSEPHLTAETTRSMIPIGRVLR